jgi:hypothetical protein
MTLYSIITYVTLLCFDRHVLPYALYKHLGMENINFILLLITRPHPPIIQQSINEV